MEEGLKIAAMTAAFWIGIAIANRRRKDSTTEAEAETEDVWPSARFGLFRNKDRQRRD